SMALDHGERCKVQTACRALSRRFRRRGVSVILGGGDGLRRSGLASVVAVCLLAVGALAAQPALGDQGSSSGGCVTKQGPVGSPFVDCSAGQLFNIVPPGETGTYSAEDYVKAKAGLGFPAHTRDQEPLYADLIKIAPNLK